MTTEYYKMQVDFGSIFQECKNGVSCESLPHDYLLFKGNMFVPKCSV